LGKNEPNLADLSVYGILSSIEGLSTFNDMIEHNSKIGTWYDNVKREIEKKKKK
jgi:microsomal prostaglandin-E synthase 2